MHSSSTKELVLDNQLGNAIAIDVRFNDIDEYDISIGVGICLVYTILTKMETFRVNFKSHIRNGDSLLFGTLICIFFPFIMSLIKHEDARSFIWIAILMFMVCAVPGIFIHLNYGMVNKGDVLKYAHREKEITIEHKGKPTTFSLDDIDHVDRFMSFNLAANRSSVLPWDEYNHSIIYLKNGLKFTITSLLIPNLNLPVEEEKIIIKRSLYRLAKIN